MKAGEGNLERLIKRALKGQPVSAADLLFHWNGLGRSGDHLAIRLLNRQNGWETFAQLAQTQPELRDKLAAIADLAGITREAASILQRSGIAVTEGDCPRNRALWIEQTVREERASDWDRARTMMLHDPDLLAGVLPLLESSTAPEPAARFITTVLVDHPPADQDQALRRALYHLRQRGVKLEEPPATLLQMDKEMFAFGENRVALWQPALYFRAHSAFTDSGDLYALAIFEGQSFEASDQKRDLHLDRPGFLHLADQYSRHIQSEMALAVPFHMVSPGAGRYFLQKTSLFLHETPAADRIQEFFKFMGDGAAVDPLASLRSHEPQPLAVASNVLNDPYFYHWMLSPEDISEYLREMDQMQHGPIILPESQIRDRTRQVALHALHQCFTDRTRALWAFAFEKAAFFMSLAREAKAASVWALSRGLADLTISVEDLYVATWLFERAVARAAEVKKQEQEEEHRGSLIMTPQEFQKQNQRK